MTEYVCLNPRQGVSPGEVLLRRREKEPYKTLFNLVGSSLKGKETTQACCERVIETVFPESRWTDLRVVGLKTGPGYTVWFANVNMGAFAGQFQGVWLPIEEAVKNTLLVPDLRIILPLLATGVSDWKLTEQVGPKYTLEFLPCLT